MSDEKQQFEDVLVDVRKAYRLLHDYQRLVLDSMKYIASQLGMHYNGGWPKFSGITPCGNNKDLDKWAWDWLNMLWWEFHFMSRPRENNPYLRICLLSDTGSFESESGRVDSTRTDTFDNVKASKSKLLFIADKHSEESNWKFPDYWDGTVLRELTHNNPAKYHDEKKIIFTACYDVSRLCNTESVDAMLRDFIEKSGGDIGLSIKDKVCE